MMPPYEPLFWPRKATAAPLTIWVALMVVQTNLSATSAEVLPIHKIYAIQGMFRKAQLSS